MQSVPGPHAGPTESESAVLTRWFTHAEVQEPSSQDEAGTRGGPFGSLHLHGGCRPRQTFESPGELLQTPPPRPASQTHAWGRTPQLPGNPAGHAVGSAFPLEKTPRAWAGRGCRGWGEGSPGSSEESRLPHASHSRLAEHTRSAQSHRAAELVGFSSFTQKQRALGSCSESARIGRDDRNNRNNLHLLPPGAYCVPGTVLNPLGGPTRLANHSVEFVSLLSLPAHR